MTTPSDSVIKGEKIFIKAMSIILALIITVIFLILLPYSLNEIFGTWIKIDGQLVNNPKCVNIPETDLFRCSPIEIHYKLPNNSKIYKKEDDLGIISETEYKKGDIIDIWHEKNSDPVVASFINQTPFLTGKNTLLTMILFLILSWGWVYITHTF